MDIVDESGKSVKANEEGFLIIKTPWPCNDKNCLQRSRTLRESVLE